jgi:probable DNA metabolism protein
MNAQVSVLFDGSFDGFLCIVYAYYYQKLIPRYIQEEAQYQQALDAETYFIKTDVESASKVMAALREKVSPDAAHFLYNAHLSGEEDKHMDMFRYALLGFKVGRAVDDYLKEDFVLRVHRIAKRVGSEAHLLSGFCRFAQTTQGVYYCEIAPKNYVLPILAEHFRDRMMNQAWVIHDKKRGLAAVYNGNDYVIEPVPDAVRLEYAGAEEQMQELWTAFFNTIAIKERASYKGQRQHIPLYFRGYMAEFNRQHSKRCP